MIDFNIEKPEDLWEEIEPMFYQHWQEVGWKKDQIKLNIDKELYEYLASENKLVCFTLRDDGKLIGYNAFFIERHPHYVDHIVAKNDVVFIHPKYRGKEMAEEFFVMCEETLKQSGVSICFYHMKTYKTFRTLMSKVGYEHLEEVYGKVL